MVGGWGLACRWEWRGGLGVWEGLGAWEGGAGKQMGPVLWVEHVMQIRWVEPSVQLRPAPSDRACRAELAGAWGGGTRGRSLLCR